MECPVTALSSSQGQRKASARSEAASVAGDKGMLQKLLVQREGKDGPGQWGWPCRRGEGALLMDWIWGCKEEARSRSRVTPQSALHSGMDEYFTAGEDSCAELNVLLDLKGPCP